MALKPRRLVAVRLLAVGLGSWAVSMALLILGVRAPTTVLGLSWFLTIALAVLALRREGGSLRRRILLVAGTLATGVLVSLALPVWHAHSGWAGVHGHFIHENPHDH